MNRLQLADQISTLSRPPSGEMDDEGTAHCYIRFASDSEVLPSPVSPPKVINQLRHYMIDVATGPQAVQQYRKCAQHVSCFCLFLTHLTHEVDGYVGDLVATDALFAGSVRLKPTEPQQQLLLFGDTDTPPSKSAAASGTGAGKARPFYGDGFFFLFEPCATT